MNWKRRRRLSFLLLAALLFAGCGEGRRLEPLPPDATILAFGDSLTVGVGAQPAQSYPSLLAGLSGLEVVNGGVSGETTEGGLVRLRDTLPQVQPDLLLLLEGGNDILGSIQPDRTHRNLEAMVELALEEGVQVVLIGVPNKLLFSDSANFYAEIAERHGLVFDGDTLADLLRDGALKSDAIHLNAAGYRELARAAYKLLVSHGAL